MGNKKLITITALITLVLILAIFLAVKTSNYLSLKNNCIQNNSKSDGYSVSLYFKPSTSQPDIDKFLNETKKMAGVKNIQAKTKDEALQEFVRENGNNPEILKSVNELGSNPLASSAVVNSNISNIEDFLKLEQSILDEARKSGLEIVRYDDGKLSFFQKELEKVNKSSLIKDLPSYIFSGEGSHFFEKRYSQICNPNFPRK